MARPLVIPLCTRDGTLLDDALRMAAIRVRERRAYRRPTNYVLDIRSNDVMRRFYTIGHDRLGDPYRIYREQYRHQPGRGYLMREIAKDAAGL